ncbi:MAG: hypothetical protein M3P26_12895 [Gemmatimonadota bacterium]|nr:hypothetical protein [Gemmatimonadota bacterium]
MSNRSAASRARAWLAFHLVRLAFRISAPDASLASATSITTGVSGTTYVVHRSMQGSEPWDLYTGRDPGEARRIFEGIRHRGERGEMTLTTNDGSLEVVRGRYTSSSP